MRLLCTFVLTALLWALPVVPSQGRALAFIQVDLASSAPEGQLVLEAKIVCGMVDGSFKCRQESGTQQRSRARRRPPRNRRATR